MSERESPSALAFRLGYRVDHQTGKVTKPDGKEQVTRLDTEGNPIFSIRVAARPQNLVRNVRVHRLLIYQAVAMGAAALGKPPAKIDAVLAGYEVWRDEPEDRARIRLDGLHITPRRPWPVEDS